MIAGDSILVTGGGGMLAGAFKRLLPQAVYSPRAELDIGDESAVRKRFGQLKPTILINCAAFTKVDQAEQEESLATRINGEAVGLLARICREHGTRMVHFSTDYVFDGSLRRPLRADDPVGPKGAYGRSKLAGEQNLQRENLKDWLIIRTAWLYGPGGPNFPQAILNAARAGKPLTVVNDQLGSPTFTYDLAEGTVELIKRQAKGIWHLTNDGHLTWHDFAAAILKEFKLNVPLSPITSADWKKTRPNTAIRPAYSVLDITPFATLTGKPMRDWRDAFAAYASLIQPSS